jgi:hypothetical protein
MADLLEKIESEKCRTNAVYLEALRMRTPQAGSP